MWHSGRHWPADRIRLDVIIRGKRQAKMFSLVKTTPAILTRAEAMREAKSLRESHGDLWRFRVVRWTSSKWYTRPYAVYGRRK